jgi:hypothetical protein
MLARSLRKVLKLHDTASVRWPRASPRNSAENRYAQVARLWRAIADALHYSARNIL